MHFADVTIAGAKGPTRTQLEHDRAMIVKQTEDACVAQHWSESAIDCFMHAATAAALHTCDRQLAPQPAAAAHGTPAGGNEAHHDPVIEGHVGGSGSGSGHSHRRSHDSHAKHTTHSTR